MIVKFPHKPVCPVCSFVLDAVTSMGSSDAAKPKANDVAVCLYCHAFLTFDESLTLKQMTVSDIAALPGLVRHLIFNARESLRKIAALKKRKQ